MNDYHFCDRPIETVHLIEDGLDTEDYSSDELVPVIVDLLRAKRCDLALPLMIRLGEMVDDLIDELLKMHYRNMETNDYE